MRTIYVRPDGSLTPDMMIDSSLTGLYQFGMFEADDEQINARCKPSSAPDVKTDVGGVARYENDYYHQVSQDIANVPGNPWFICACWLAEYKIALAQDARRTARRARLAAVGRSTTRCRAACSPSRSTPIPTRRSPSRR